MAEGISLDRFRVLVENAGFSLSDEELVALKPMYDHYIPAIQAMNGEDLGPEDLAVVFNPVSDS